MFTIFYASQLKKMKIEDRIKDSLKNLHTRLGELGYLLPEFSQGKNH
jgi:hypothetical protein